MDEGETSFDSEDDFEGDQDSAPEEPPTEAAAACADGPRYDHSGYHSDELANHSPGKKPRSGDSQKSGGGRKTGSKSTRQVYFGPIDHFV